MQKKRPTISDVAKLSGVSQTTVSGVMNNSGLYARETIVRVHNAMAELGYFPRSNKLRQANIKKRGQATVAILANDVFSSSLSTPLFSKLAAGVESELDGKGFRLLSTHLDADGRLPAIFHDKKTLKGVIIRHGYSDFPPEIAAENDELLRGFPVVNAFASDYSYGDGVCVDNESCAYWAFNQVMAMAPQKIYCIRPPRPERNLDLFIRCAVFEFLLRNAGVECVTCVAPENEAQFTAPGWERQTPTAMFVVAHDYTVNSVLRGLSGPAHRTRVWAVMTGELPGEPVGDFLRMIHIDPFRIGVAAAQMLRRRIEHPHEGYQRAHILPPELQHLAPENAR